MQNKNKIVLFNSEFTDNNIELIRADSTLWATQKQMSDIFGVHPNTINGHIKNLTKDNKINVNSTTRSYRIVQIEGDREVIREVIHYNFHVIVQIGFKSNSEKASEFVLWATDILTKYEVDGYAINTNLIENSETHSDAFNQTARDIRTSDKEVNKRLRGIIAHYTLDYNPESELVRKFFSYFQNKIHYAASGLTAAGLVLRADATKPNMGLITFNGVNITTADIPIGKNYLTKMELEISKSVTIMFLEQANIVILTNQKIPMSDWLLRLENCIKICGLNVLIGYGFVNPIDAKNHAYEQYQIYNPKYKPRKNKKKLK